MGTVAIVGAGASGLVAALEAARAGADVLLFEANERVGKTILATGNGRCNFSNAHPEKGDYRNARFVANVLTASQSVYAQQHDFAANEERPHFVADYLMRLGLLWREEDGAHVPRSRTRRAPWWTCCAVRSLRMASKSGAITVSCPCDPAKTVGWKTRRPP